MRTKYEAVMQLQKLHFVTKIDWKILKLRLRWSLAALYENS